MNSSFRAVWVAATLVVVYVAVVRLTPLQHSGDTSYYVNDVLAYHLQKEKIRLWEAGHLIWRPLSYVVASITSVIVRRPFDAVLVTQVLVGLNWLLGLLFVLFTYLTAKRLTTHWLAFTIACSVMITNAFLNYVHSGCSYVPGLAFLSIALYVIVSDLSKFWKLFLSLFFLCLSVSMWLLYILAAPALVLLLTLHVEDKRERWQTLLTATLVFALLICIPYVCAAYIIGIENTDDLVRWFTQASHGITHVRGIPRAAFGFARSVFYMGDDGTLFKRFLLKDPYNPVPISELLRVSLMKVAFFYGWFLSVFLHSILRSRPSIIKYVTLVGTVSVFGFAVLWQGGDLERYFPLVPILVLAIASMMRQFSALPALIRYFNLVCVIALLTFNVVERTHDIRRLDARVSERVATVSQVVASGLLKKDDLLILATAHDELFGSGRTAVSNEALPRRCQAVWPGHKDAPRWRESLSAKILEAWNESNSVWVATRLLAGKPKADWKWVEGDDPRVSWKDIRSFFTAMEYGQNVGGEDGFLLLLKNERNKRRLMKWIGPDRSPN